MHTLTPSETDTDPLLFVLLLNGGMGVIRRSVFTSSSSNLHPLILGSSASKLIWQKYTHKRCVRRVCMAPCPIFQASFLAGPSLGPSRHAPATMDRTLDSLWAWIIVLFRRKTDVGGGSRCKCLSARRVLGSSTTARGGCMTSSSPHRTLNEMMIFFSLSLATDDDDLRLRPSWGSGNSARCKKLVPGALEFL